MPPSAVWGLAAKKWLEDLISKDADHRSYYLFVKILLEYLTQPFGPSPKTAATKKPESFLYEENVNLHDFEADEDGSRQPQFTWFLFRSLSQQYTCLLTVFNLDYLLRCLITIRPTGDRLQLCSTRDFCEPWARSDTGRRAPSFSF